MYAPREIAPVHLVRELELCMCEEVEVEGELHLLHQKPKHADEQKSNPCSCSEGARGVSEETVPRQLDRDRSGLVVRLGSGRYHWSLGSPRPIQTGSRNLIDLDFEILDEVANFDQDRARTLNR